MLTFCILLLFGLAASSSSPAPRAATPHRHYERDTLLADERHLHRRQFPNESLVAQVFEVTPPVLGWDGQVVGAGRPVPFTGVETTVVTGSSDECKVTLAVRSFANSFNQPFVGQYTPPACLGDSNTAVMNLTVETIGRQFDRLSFIFLGDTELLRWSTAQPRRNGVTYTAIKDVSSFLPLWRQPQKVIFDLGNLLNENLSGIFNTTLEVTFFQAPGGLSSNANTIIPISRRVGLNESQPSVFNTGDVNATTIVTDFPRNARKAIFTIQSCGQIGEEFWWSNLPSSTALTFNATGNPSGGYSAYREIQLYIDDQLAGIQAPFPIIFTGGLNPAFWSPVVGIDVFDEKEAEIDITPFLPVLCDGAPHNFTLRVVGLDDGDNTSATLSTGVDSYWQLSGKVFVWTEDDASFITTGSAPVITTIDPVIKLTQTLTQNTTGANETLKYDVSVSRSIRIFSDIMTREGQINASWAQDVTTIVNGFIGDFGNTSSIQFKTTTTSSSARDETVEYSTSDSYPLVVNSTQYVLPNDTVRTDIILSRSKDTIRTVGGEDVFPSRLQVFSVLPATADIVPSIKKVSLSTSQDGHGVRLVFPGGGPQNGSYAEANLEQNMLLGGKVSGATRATELYFRDVSVRSDGTIVSDIERVAGSEVAPGRAGLRRPGP
ncbi:peptide-N4-(N-acetyl-beta-glucosaminyl)asparagine amidase A [Diaporthe helianthi]|uniref:Peptide-N4-(N-acetyl-beta-glucosaminyl)asparagine amidase A n=1 Tax=Diaporthe helianthi TaxID=158607 RepID=A0A2P5HG05_DIAHE|nr:peptide-N4-(N-acetyl-beta-glucosaminyl)asparagine amidase A [Diaporthe helianthi]